MFAPPVDGFRFLSLRAEAETFPFNEMRKNEAFCDSRPYVRWWWLRGSFEKRDIKIQLLWLKEQGFGGVEIAWMRPHWLNPCSNRPEDDRSHNSLGWLTDKFSERITYTKKTAEKLGLGCDFTFGSAWPFGGKFLREEETSQTLDDRPSYQTFQDSWETGRVPVLNHLSKQALDRYSEVLGKSFSPALGGRKSALFCDSLELEKERLWNPDLWKIFEKKFGYDLKAHRRQISSDPDLRYDVNKMVGITILNNFYQHFTTNCHRLEALSRVQCHGAPTDLLAAYAAADVPESESLLFNPGFSKIAASAGALEDRSVVSCESFTCLYGFPREHHKNEQIGDLKFLADALFANGVNQIVWHGMPFNSPNGEDSFYATCHVGPDSAFAAHTKAFNSYLSTVSAYMRLGKTYAQLAIYLPNEDMMRRGMLPRHKQTPGANDYWEMRDVEMPKETKGYAPLWISAHFLNAAKVINGMLVYKEQQFQALYIDVEWLDREALTRILELAKEGLQVVLKQEPKQPGHNPTSRYAIELDELLKLPNVKRDLESLPPALVRGTDLPSYWVREHKDDFYIFFAHPETRSIKYPMKYSQSRNATAVELSVEIHTDQGYQKIPLHFGQEESLLVKVTNDSWQTINLPPWRQILT